MKRMFVAVAFAAGLVAAAEAQEAVASQADLQAIIERLNRLEAENKAQAQRIAELEGRLVAGAAEAGEANGAAVAKDEGTEVSESGKVYTTKQGFKYYLADAAAGIFEPLSESGLKVTPYGWLVFEGVWADHGLDLDWATDFVQPKSSHKYNGHNSSLSMADSILGLRFETPEAVNGWTFSGKAEFDFAGDNADDYAFHWRHLYVDAAHESGWSVLFGQTWHLWKMVTPSEIDGAWMENAGHPYRRSPQIRVTKKWDWGDSSLEARAGFVKNGPNASTDRDDDGVLDSVASSWGWLEGALVYDRDAFWEEGDRRWLVGLGGMYGQDRSHRITGAKENGDYIYGKDDDYNSQMIMLAGSLPLLDKFTLTGQFYAGENLGRVQAGCAQSVAYVNGIGRKGKELDTVGGFVDLGYKLNDTWSFALGYGMDDPSNSKLEKQGKGIMFNDRAYIDAFYRITSNFRLALEYARLTTKYVGESTADANRFQFSAFYDF